MIAKLNDGFELEIPDNFSNNTELLDEARQTEKNPLMIFPLSLRLLGEEQRDLLYEHLRGKDGVVPFDAFCKSLNELMEYSKEGKNSSASPN